jgi:plastocyanin
VRRSLTPMWLVAAGLLPLSAAAVESGVKSAPAQRTAASATDSCPASAGLPRGAVADHGSVAARDGGLSLDAGDSYFEPTCATGVPPGEITLHIRNSGRLLHNISFADQAIDQDIAPGDSATITVKMGKESLRFACKYHSAAGMVGALVAH